LTANLFLLPQMSWGKNLPNYDQLLHSNL